MREEIVDSGCANEPQDLDHTALWLHVNDIVDQFTKGDA